MNRFRSLPQRHHGVHWVMLIVLVLHVLAPHGGWRGSASGPQSDLQAQSLAASETDAAWGYICGVGDAGRKTLPLHDFDGPKCQASAPPPSAPALAMAAVSAPVFTLLPFNSSLPPGAGVVYAYPWPNAPPVHLG
jgi:hypothetical protein